MNDFIAKFTEVYSHQQISEEGQRAQCPKPHHLNSKDENISSTVNNIINNNSTIKKMEREKKWKIQKICDWFGCLVGVAFLN